MNFLKWYHNLFQDNFRKALIVDIFWISKVFLMWCMRKAFLITYLLQQSGGLPKIVWATQQISSHHTKVTKLKKKRKSNHIEVLKQKLLPLCGKNLVMYLYCFKLIVLYLYQTKIKTFLKTHLQKQINKRAKLCRTEIWLVHQTSR